MKKILILAIVCLGFTTANAQNSPPVTTKITKGYGNFTIDKMTFPLNSVIINARNTDTSFIEIDFVNGTEAIGRSGTVVAMKKRVYYINGTTGIPFTSYTAMKGYCDSFLYSH